MEALKQKIDEALKEVMAHAVSGHSDDGYHVYCNDPSHAVAILLKRKVLLLVPGEKYSVVHQDEKEG